MKKYSNYIFRTIACDTGGDNTDNQMTVNIVTESMNSASSLSNLDSNQHFRIVYKDDIGGYLLYPICSMNGSRRVIGKASASELQIILKNYASASLDAVDIVYSGSGSTYALKLGSFAAADSSNNVVYSSYSSTASAQKWTLAADITYVNDDVLYAGIGTVIDYPIASGTNDMYLVTSGFGYRVYNGIDFHNGLDIGVGVGTALYAPFDGTVVDIGSGDDRGRYIAISGSVTYNAQTYDLVVCYFHLNSSSEYNSMQVGQTVERGDIVGRSGSSGANGDGSYGEHLHMVFATAYSGRNVVQSTLIDPLRFYSTIEWGRQASTDSIPKVIA